MRLSPRELLILFVIGAAGGLVGDAGHVQTETTRYLDDSLPFVWESAVWFPFLVGLATASIGELRLWLAPPRPGGDWRLAVAAIAAVVGIYALTALVSDEPELPATTLVAALAVLTCAAIADRAGLICATIAALAGPVAEIAVVELELAEYGESADSLLGVGLWLPALYLAFGAVAARLAEILVARRPGPAGGAGALT